MRSDAQEAALGLLGLTGNIDFTKTTTANAHPTSTSMIPLKRGLSTSAFASSSTSSQPQPHSLANILNDDEFDDVEATTSSETIDCVCGFTYDDGFSVACDKCGTWVHAACFDIAHGNVPEIFKCWKCDSRGGLEKLKEKATRIQRARQRDLDVGTSVTTTEAEKGGSGGSRRRVTSPGIERKRRVSIAAIDGGNPKRRRRLSTGAGTQTLSQSQTHHPQHPHNPQAGAGAGEDEHVDIDEPATNSYVHTDKDFIPHQQTRDRLKRLAQHWRGLTALDGDDELLSSLKGVPLATAPVCLTPDELPGSPQTSLHPLPKSAYSQSLFSSNVDFRVRPPSYTVRTTQPVPSEAFIVPYTSTIIPSTVYLSDPLNSYAHLGMPKPFVHLIGPPLDIALDARLAGNGSRFVRNGCRPNAVLRPVLCRQAQNDRPKSSSPGSTSEETLTFGVFALRDLKAQEEIVLGWEWDDGSVIHQLPALIDSPHLFAPARFEQYRHQMTSMLHALSSTFTTCACGSNATDCALNRLAEFVDGQTPPTPAPSPPSVRDERPMDDDRPTLSRSNIRRVRVDTDLGPLVGVQRGFKTRERVPMSGGMGGVEMDISHSPVPPYLLPAEAGPSGLSRLSGADQTHSEPRESIDQRTRYKGKERFVAECVEMDAEPPSLSHQLKHEGPAQGHSVKKKRSNFSVQATSSSQSNPRPSPNPQGPTSSTSPTVPPRVGEARLPPKLRKRWIHQNAEVLKEAVRPEQHQTYITSSTGDAEMSSAHDRMDVDDEGKDHDTMPPPPLPSTISSPPRPSPINDLPIRMLDPTDVTSPSASFANLSLLVFCPLHPSKWESFFFGSSKPSLTRKHQFAAHSPFPDNTIRSRRGKFDTRLAIRQARSLLPFANTCNV
ncbi:hypothetical protein BDW22DRAFT_316242 [Trametopsis cervina]|nr:hypothetical protein BDW22DRAFT_316242 [Trametopsis cervina]